MTGVAGARQAVSALCLALFLADPACAENLEFALDQLDTDLASNGNTGPIEIISAAGEKALPLLCERLHRPAMFAAADPGRKESIINISYAIVVMHHKYPNTLAESVRCAFDWTMKAERRDPYQLLLRSTIAVDFGNAALPALVNAWAEASLDGAAFERAQQVGNNWFRSFCNRDGLEAQTVTRLAEIADTLNTTNRANLYSHIASLAGCTDQAVAVLKDAFALENDPAKKRMFHRLQLQAQQIAGRQNHDE